MLKVRAFSVGVNQESRRVECLKKPCTRLAGHSTRTRVATSTSRSSSWCAISLAALHSSAAAAATPAPLVISSHALHAFTSCARAQAIHVTQHGAPQEKLELAFKVPVPCTPRAKWSHRNVQFVQKNSIVYWVFFSLLRAALRYWQQRHHRVLWDGRDHSGVHPYSIILCNRW